MIKAVSEFDSRFSIVRGFHAVIFNTCSVFIGDREGLTSELASSGQIKISTLKQEQNATGKR